jgi:ferrous iron transport protein B
MFDSGWAFVRRAGTLILASMVLVWALLYFPSGHPEGGTYPERIARAEASIAPQKEELDRKEEGLRDGRKEVKRLRRREGRADGPRREELRRQREELEARIEEEVKPLKEKVDPVQDEINKLRGAWKRRSFLGRAGKAVEPAVKPLGWDWRIGVAALASFPAREVVVGTLGILYNVGKVDSDEIREEEDVAGTDLGQKLREARWDDDPEKPRVFTVPVALSLMVFFALCCQCASTLAVIRRETRTWRWPLFTFTYMTVLAYLGALAVYQVGRLFS